MHCTHCTICYDIALMLLHLLSLHHCYNIALMLLHLHSMYFIYNITLMLRHLHSMYYSYNITLDHQTWSNNTKNCIIVTISHNYNMCSIHKFHNIVTMVTCFPQNCHSLERLDLEECLLVGGSLCTPTAKLMSPYSTACHTLTDRCVLNSVVTWQSIVSINTFTHLQRDRFY